MCKLLNSVIYIDSFFKNVYADLKRRYPSLKSTSEKLLVGPVHGYGNWGLKPHLPDEPPQLSYCKNNSGPPWVPAPPAHGSSRPWLPARFCWDSAAHRIGRGASFGLGRPGSALCCHYHYVISCNASMSPLLARDCYLPFVTYYNTIYCFAHWTGHFEQLSHLVPVLLRGRCPRLHWVEEDAESQETAGWWAFSVQLRSCVASHRVSLGAVLLQHLRRLVSEPSPLSSPPGGADVSVSHQGATAVLPPSAGREFSQRAKRFFCWVHQRSASFTVHTEPPVPWPWVPRRSPQSCHAGTSQVKGHVQTEGRGGKKGRLMSMCCTVLAHIRRRTGVIITAFLWPDNLRAGKWAERVDHVGKGLTAKPEHLHF